MQTSKRINYIKNWILDCCKSMSNQPDSLIVGISGGIDSSVTSTICALTGKKTIVLSMPIKQIKEQHNLSLKHKNWLKEKFKNVEGHLINLDLLFETFKQSLSNFNDATVLDYLIPMLENSYNHEYYYEVMNLANDINADNGYKQKIRQASFKAMQNNQ